MEMRFYPFPTGAVLAIKMEKGAAHSLVRRGESASLGDALRKTKLFTEDKIKPIENKGIADTIVGIISTTSYVLFKKADAKSWDENSAKNDVDTIIEKVKASYERR